MIKGSCLCGEVAYEITGELGDIVFCHCQQCRKAQGSAFAAISAISESNFNLVKGSEYLQSFESSPGKIRTFCKQCGSPIYSKRTSVPNVVRIRVGSLDTVISAKPAFHIYAASKAEWYDINDNCKQYDEMN